MAANITANQHVVVIVADDYSCTVAPGQLLVNEQDEVTFLNLTTDRVTIEFPKGNPFGEAVGNIKPGEGEKDRITRTVQQNLPSRIYHYTAYCHAKKQYAEGSIPRIIIHRKLV